MTNLIAFTALIIASACNSLPKETASPVSETLCHINNQKHLDKKGRFEFNCSDQISHFNVYCDLSTDPLENGGINKLDISTGKWIKQANGEFLSFDDGKTAGILNCSKQQADSSAEEKGAQFKDNYFFTHSFDPKVKEYNDVISKCLKVTLNSQKILQSYHSCTKSGGRNAPLEQAIGECSRADKASAYFFKTKADCESARKEFADGAAT